VGKTTVEAKPHFGRRIVQLREDRGLNRTELAELSGIPYKTLQNWEGLEKPPRSGKDRIRTLEKILGGTLWGADNAEGAGYATDDVTR